MRLPATAGILISATNIKAEVLASSYFDFTVVPFHEAKIC
jgi:hypothetical protein